MKEQDKAIDAEVIPTQAVAVRPQSAIGQAMGVEDIIAQVNLIQSVMHRVMKEGEHYGTIPGCGDKKTLLQPGAQKLTMTFRLCPEYVIQEVNLDRGHKEYRIICTLKSMGSGSFVGQGVGCCSTMESKYRWRGGSRKCPKCGKESIIKGKAEYGGGWLCYGKKGGCGAKWPDGSNEIEGQSVDKVETDSPADNYNTVLKMAKKRAFVDATITATAASDIFTQDIGDAEEEPEATSTPPPNPTPPAANPAQVKNLEITDKFRTKMIENLKAAPGTDNRKVCLEYFRKAGQLLPNEELEDLDLRFVPADKKQMDALINCISNFEAGGDLVRAFDPHWDTSAPKEKSKPSTNLDVPRGESAEPSEADDEPWYNVIVPVPHKGQKRDEYLKNPDTIGSLYDARHDDDDARKRLWGFATNYEPKGWEKRDGTKMPPSASDIKFREALDQFVDWFEKNHPDEKL